MDSDVVRAVAILGQSLRHRFHSLMLSEMVGFEIIQHPDDFPVGWEGGPGRGSRMVFVTSPGGGGVLKAPPHIAINIIRSRCRHRRGFRAGYKIKMNIFTLLYKLKSSE